MIWVPNEIEALISLGSQRYSSGLFLGSSLWAQSTEQVSTPAPAAPPAPDTSSAPSEGKDIGGFHVTQSIELGGRISDVSGSQAMYDTLVNLQSGARILEQSLTMQSLTHHDIFDTLTLNSFGWGGDPEQAVRMRVSKYGWYNFSASYQHMQNYFDYDLLANPLNPADRSVAFHPDSQLAAQLLRSPKSLQLRSRDPAHAPYFISRWTITAIASAARRSAAFTRAPSRSTTRTGTPR